MKVEFRHPVALSAAWAIALTMAPEADAQTVESRIATEVDEPTDHPSHLDPVIVTGTRRSGVTVPESSTPIDIVSGAMLERQGHGDLNDALRTLVPSLNVQRFSAQNTSAAVRPFSLRGLSPDETLVLVNGKRRHRSAAIQLSRLPLASGSQGPDLATIPMIAIERVEILRDGASAQYGSDAIAGVVNFRLKRASEGGLVLTRYGEYTKGDGQDFTIAANVGLKLSDRGFVNLSAEVTRAKPTDRAIQRADAARLVAAGNTAIADPVQPWGNTDSEGRRLFVNGELPIDDRTSLYAFGNYGESRADATQFWRDPTPTGSRADIFASVPLTNVAGGPRYSFAQTYPGGLLPIHRYRVKDASLTAGVKGTIGDDLDYDLSASAAESRIRFNVLDTVNPSLGPGAPTTYYVGAQRQQEEQLHADFVTAWDPKVLASPVNVAFGAEYRQETFQIEPGDATSYAAGPFARVIDPDTGRAIGLAVGSSAFPGLQPSQSGRWSRRNWAAYLDLETDVVRDVTLGLAARFEKFSDFGGTFNWKTSARWQVARPIALRASYNTGFRAPTPGQQHVTAIANNVNLQTGGLLVAATLPPSDAIARYYGAQDLRPEKSRNVSAGLVLTLPGDFVATVDWFHIRVKDRIGVTSPITVTAADQAALAARGIALNGTQTVAFFANAFSTTTRGVDAVLSKHLHVHAADVTLSAAANYTKTTPFDITDARAVDRERFIELSTFNPRWRGNLTGTVAFGSWNLLTRLNYYGSWTDAVPVPSAVAFDQRHAPRWLTDVEVAYQVNKRVSVALGAMNLFDKYPEREALPANVANGMQYPQHSPFGYNGRFVYARAQATL